MRRRAGSWSFTRTAGSTVGASPPRPCARVIGVAAFTALIHALLIVWAWTGLRAGEPPRASRMSMRLVARPAAAAVTALAAPAPVVPAPVVHSPVATARNVRPRIEAPVKPIETANEPAAAPQAQEAVVGVAFGPLRLGWPGASTPMRSTIQPTAPPPTMPPIPQLLQAQSMREAARAQIDQTLQRQFADTLPPHVASGACALSAEPQDTRLACDSDALMQALASRETALIGLLRAYRSIEPRTSGLSIAIADGRYQVSWTVPAAGALPQRLAVGASVISTPRDVTVTAPGL